MKKVLKFAAGAATITLLFSSLTWAQPQPVTTTITITKPSPGAKVCYRPSHRTITATRTIRRCGPNGICRDIRVTREFDVGINEDCHMVKEPSCPGGYKSFGWFPSRAEARDAVERCRHTINGNVPAEWNVTY